jgi:cytochrome c biogenesis protein CcmG/thiol:disulfide interchange protein DsbE
MASQELGSMQQHPNVPPELDASEPEEEQMEEYFRTPFRRPSAGSIRNIVGTLAVAALIIGVVWFIEGSESETSQAITLTASASGPAPRVDEPAPPFDLKTLDGEVVSLSDYKGQPVWINFWASWCPPCRAENPDIEEMYQKYKDQGLVILSPAIGEDPSAVSGYVKRTGLTFTVGLDETTQLAANYRIVGIPTHFFIDREGILRVWRIGSMSTSTMEKNIETIMSTAAEEP